MSNNLDSIILKIRNSIDSEDNEFLSVYTTGNGIQHMANQRLLNLYARVLNYAKLVEAVSDLEVFPMTMGQLQDTRVGKLLQVVRQKVDPALQKRIRCVIKAWQLLLKPGGAVSTVIPLNISEVNNHNKVPTLPSSDLSKQSVASASKVTSTNGKNGQCLSATKLFPSANSKVITSRNASTALQNNLIRSASTSALLHSDNALSPAVTSSPNRNPRRPEHGSKALPSVAGGGKKAVALSLTQSPVKLKRVKPSHFESRLPTHLLNNGRTNSRSLVSGDENSMSPSLFSHQAQAGGGSNHTVDHAGWRSTQPGHPLINQLVHVPMVVAAIDVDTHSLASDSSVRTGHSRNRHMASPTPARPTAVLPPTPAPSFPSRLAKVKSTAELVQASGDCIDPVTADRILTNSIAKESYLLPPTHSTLNWPPPPGPGRTRHARAVAGGPPTLAGLTSAALRPSAPRGPDVGGAQSPRPRDPAPSEVVEPQLTRLEATVSAAKSEMMAKFLESTALQHQLQRQQQDVPRRRTNRVADLSVLTSQAAQSPGKEVEDGIELGPAVAVGTRVLTGALVTQPVDEIMCEPSLIDEVEQQRLAGVKKEQKRKRKQHRHQPGGRESEVESASGEDQQQQQQNQQLHQHHHRRRRRRRHRRHPEGQEATPPVTNRLDDWPTMPSMPDAIDWHSLSPLQSQQPLLPGDTADQQVAGTNDWQSQTDANKDGDVARLLSGTWPGRNCVPDDKNCQHRLTELYAVPLGDRTLHILPWVDMLGYQRTFFPSNATNQIDQLIDLPHPW